MEKYVWVVFFIGRSGLRVFSTSQAAYDAMRDYLFEISSSDEEFHNLMEILIEKYDYDCDYFGDNFNCYAEKVRLQ